MTACRALLASLFLTVAAPQASACSAYSCDGVGWQDYDPEKPGVMAAFQAARRAGTASALAEFIRTYPGSPAASQAIDLRAKMGDASEAAGEKPAR